MPRWRAICTRYRELHRHGITSIECVGVARLEANGKITVLTRDALARDDRGDPLA